MTRDAMFDAVVVGTGPAGLVTGLALAHEGVRTAVIGPPAEKSPAQDPRTTALFAGSVELLRHLGVWPGIARTAVPLAGLRFVDDTGHLLRAPETLFRAGELGLDAFGFNVDNMSLAEALHQRALIQTSLTILAGTVVGLDDHGTHVGVTLSDGQSLRAALVAAADGRGSTIRAHAGITHRAWSYPQSALATKFQHSRAHACISTEFHRAAGPLTTVPLSGTSSSLVWVERPEEAARLKNLTPDLFAAELEQRLQGLLGSISQIGPRSVFPLSGLTADRLAHRRVALVGEAAHVLPPIGAQGLNLGFRDAAVLADVAGSAQASGLDPGGDTALADYETRRAADVLSRTMAVDLLNRSLISGFLPLHLARGAGLHLLGAFPPLRQLVMREGMQPSFALPRLMQPLQSS
ncbi:MAG: UbiH/UbiF family hydroxylase [Hyphomicrobiaceae bacterium]